MGHSAQLIQKMQDRMVANIRWHMADGKSYADAAAIVKVSSCAGPAVWNRINAIFEEVRA